MYGIVWNIVNLYLNAVEKLINTVWFLKEEINLLLKIIDKFLK